MKLQEKKGSMVNQSKKQHASVMYCYVRRLTKPTNDDKVALAPMGANDLLSPHTLLQCVLASYHAYDAIFFPSCMPGHMAVYVH